jgi:hypothetical protein
MHLSSDPLVRRERAVGQGRHSGRVKALAAWGGGRQWSERVSYQALE